MPTSPIAFRLITYWLLASCVALASFSNAQSTPRPNVLFLICDDLNCDISCYGHPQVKTPNIDRLAARGIRFTEAHCQYPLCGPSRASMMAGWYPDQTLIHRNAIHLRERAPDAVSIPQHFRNAGYFATRIGKIYHYNVPLHIGTGGHDDPYSWNMTINPRGRDVIDQDDVFSLRPGSYGGTLSWLAAEGTDDEQTDGIAAAEAIARLKSHQQDGSPFFLAVGMYRPHTPYVAPKKYFDLYPVDQINVPTVPDGYLDTLPPSARRTLTRKKEQVNLDDQLARQAIQAYYASITFVDAQLGLILDALEASGQADNTVILFTSDHGYHMGEHGYYQKTTLFNNATHIPLIMAGPGIKSGDVAKTFAEMVDFYPTLSELAGLKTPALASGKSLVPALKDPSVIVRDSALTQFDNGYSLRTSRYRYTRWTREGQTEQELYDRQSDPAEMINLASQPEQQAMTRKLNQQLQQRIGDANAIPAGMRKTEGNVARMVRIKNKR